MDNCRRIQVSLFAVVLFSQLLFGCGGKIDGQLVDNFGNPVAGADVSIENSAYKAVTAEDGAFRLEYAPGKFNVVFQKEGFVSVSKELDVATLTTYKLGKVDIVRYQKVRGIVVDNFGKPVVGADVLLVNQERRATTVAGGVFELSALSRDDEVVVSMNGFTEMKEALAIPLQPDFDAGTLSIFRIPGGKSISYAGAEDFLVIPETKLSTTNEVREFTEEGWSYSRLLRTYTLRKGADLPVIHGPEIRLFDTSGEQLGLASVRNGQVAVETIFDNGSFPSVWEKHGRDLDFEAKGEETPPLGNDGIMRVFNVGSSGTYCLIRIIKEHKKEHKSGNIEEIDYTYTKDEAFCWRVDVAGSASAAASASGQDLKYAPTAVRTVVPVGDMTCDEPGVCPPNPSAVYGFLARICDGSFGPDNVVEVAQALSTNRLDKADLPWLFNMYGASWGYVFKKLPHLNTFYYGPESAKWLPTSCLAFRNSLKSQGSMSIAQRDSMEAIKALR